MNLESRGSYRGAPTSVKERELENIVSYRAAYTLRADTGETSLWVAAVVASMRPRVSSYGCMLIIHRRYRAGGNTIHLICMLWNVLSNTVSTGARAVIGNRKMRLNLYRKYCQRTSRRWCVLLEALVDMLMVVISQ